MEKGTAKGHGFSLVIYPPLSRLNQSVGSKKTTAFTVSAQSDNGIVITELMSSMQNQFGIMCSWQYTYAEYAYIMNGKIICMLELYLFIVISGTMATSLRNLAYKHCQLHCCNNPWKNHL